MLSRSTFCLASFRVQSRQGIILGRRWAHVGRQLPPLLDDLSARGLVAQVTSPNLAKEAASGPLSVYLGVDPTARSLHAGNLLALMGLLHFHIRGHPVIALIGGATGSIGDPGGRSTERPLLSSEALATNVEGLTAQAHRFFENGSIYAAKRSSISRGVTPPSVLNNIEWFKGMGLLHFLRTVGKHAKVNVMIGRDSVKNRLASEQGISFTEFSYQLLQAYDFHTLHQRHNVRVQLGGSDQWGNIVAGIDLIRRRGSSSAPSSSSSSSESEISPNTEGDKEEVFGLTIPLLLTSSGAKFGKSAGNAVWLDSGLTSFFDFYQFFMHVSDADVIPYLRMFTLLSREEIDGIAAQHQEHPERRIAQRKLASEVVELVHGEDAVRQAEAATSVLFGPSTGAGAGADQQIVAKDVISALRTDPRLKSDLSAEKVIGESLTKLAAEYGLTKSRGEARKLLSAGGFYLNNQRIREDRPLGREDLIDERIVILRTGKDNHVILALE